MRNIFTQRRKNTDTCNRPLQNNAGHNILKVACHNKQIAATGRTTTTYIISNDNDDVSPCDASFFLMPDPYAGQPNKNENYTTDAAYSEEDFLFEQTQLYTMKITATTKANQLNAEAMTTSSARSIVKRMKKIIGKAGVFAIVLLIAMFALSSIASVATKTWDGDATNDNWSTATNWNGNTLPVAGREFLELF